MATRKTARWLDLIAFLLQHKYPVPRDDIFRAVRGYGVDPDDASDRAVESARRKFERDKDELRALGIAIETLPVPNHEGGEPGSAYRLKPSAFYLPYFELDETPPPERPYPGLERVRMTRREVRVLDRATRRLAEREEFPLAEAARSLRQKLAFDLPLSQAAVERVLAHPLPPSAQAALAVLQRAVAERRPVRCTYHSMSSGQEATREIEPWRLWFERGHWYCVGLSRDRGAARILRAVRLWPERLGLPLQWSQPRMIFVNSMSDLFHHDVPDEYAVSVFRVMLTTDRHIYQVLTKRPARAARFWERWAKTFDLTHVPDQIWIGTSIERAEVSFRARHLRAVPARVRFLSCEPLLGPLDDLELDGIHWVIGGGESGPNARPVHLSWAVGLRDRCTRSGVPFFWKQWGGRTPKVGGRMLEAREWSQYPPVAATILA